MTKFPCLILDHDDTVVQSEATINYPFFCQILDAFRPGATITLQEYIQGCSDLGFVPMCKERFSFTDEELVLEYKSWKEYIRSHIPLPYAGIADVIRRQVAEGGKVFVISMSSEENIRRDYLAHFQTEPDGIYGWDLAQEHRKPSPYAVQQIMKLHGYRRDEVLVVDDMKPAWEMARAAGVTIGFAAWGRLEYPKILEQMSALCDHTFYSTQELSEFLFG